MIRILSTALLCFILSLSTLTAKAATTAELKKLCEANNPLDKSLCTGYLTGATESLVALRVLYSMEQLRCLHSSDAVSIEQIRDIFLRYARSKPDSLEQPASNSIIKSLQLEYKCKS